MDHKESTLSYFTNQLFSQNQILVAILGICSALGVTSRIPPAIAMGLSVTFVTSFSCFFVSMFRRQTPDSVRMITQLAFISLFTIVIDQVLQAYYFSISKVLSVYVGLIITNCILMGRTEGMAKNVSPLPAFLDGLGAGLGYTFVLVSVAAIREFFGFGQLLGYQIIPTAWYGTAANPHGYQNFTLMVSPPASFFILGTMIFLMKTLQSRKKR